MTLINPVHLFNVYHPLLQIQYVEWYILYVKYSVLTTV